MLGETGKAIPYFKKYEAAKEQTLSLKKIHEVSDLERSQEIKSENALLQIKTV